MLARYGVIPEVVPSITSVTTLMRIDRQFVETMRQHEPGIKKVASGPAFYAITFRILRFQPRFQREKLSSQRPKEVLRTPKYIILYFCFLKFGCAVSYAGIS